MEYESEAYGETAVQDLAACEKAAAVLQSAYPNHPFLIGIDHSSGGVHCRLMYDGQAPGNNGYGFLLHLSTIQGPDGDRRLRQAGGECLERFGLARGAATEQSALRALEHGLDIDGCVTKSRY